MKRISPSANARALRGQYDPDQSEIRTQYRALKQVLKLLKGSNWSLFLTFVFFGLAVVMMAIKIGESVGTSDGSAAEFSDLGGALFSLTETQDERDTAKMLYTVCALVRLHESRFNVGNWLQISAVLARRCWFRSPCRRS